MSKRGRKTGPTVKSERSQTRGGRTRKNKQNPYPMEAPNFLNYEHKIATQLNDDYIPNGFLAHGFHSMPNNQYPIVPPPQSYIHPHQAQFQYMHNFPPFQMTAQLPASTANFPAAVPNFQSTSHGFSAISNSQMVPPSAMPGLTGNVQASSFVAPNFVRHNAGSFPNNQFNMPNYQNFNINAHNGRMESFQTPGQPTGIVPVNTISNPYAPNAPQTNHRQDAGQAKNHHVQQPNEAMQVGEHHRQLAQSAVNETFNLQRSHQLNATRTPGVHYSHPPSFRTQQSPVEQHIAENQSRVGCSSGSYLGSNQLHSIVPTNRGPSRQSTSNDPLRTNLASGDYQMSSNPASIGPDTPIADSPCLNSNPASIIRNDQIDPDFSKITKKSPLSRQLTPISTGMGQKSPFPPRSTHNEENTFGLVQTPSSSIGVDEVHQESNACTGIEIPFIDRLMTDNAVGTSQLSTELPGAPEHSNSGAMLHHNQLQQQQQNPIFSRSALKSTSSEHFDDPSCEKGNDIQSSRSADQSSNIGIANQCQPQELQPHQQQQEQNFFPPLQTTAPQEAGFNCHQQGGNTAFMNHPTPSQNVDLATGKSHDQQNQVPSSPSLQPTFSLPQSQYNYHQEKGNGTDLSKPLTIEPVQHNYQYEPPKQFSITLSPGSQALLSQKSQNKQENANEIVVVSEKSSQDVLQVNDNICSTSVQTQPPQLPKMSENAQRTGYSHNNSLYVQHQFDNSIDVTKKLDEWSAKFMPPSPVFELKDNKSNSGASNKHNDEVSKDLAGKNSSILNDGKTGATNSLLVLETEAMVNVEEILLDDETKACESSKSSHTNEATPRENVQYNLEVSNSLNLIDNFQEPTQNSLNSINIVEPLVLSTSPKPSGRFMEDLMETRDNMISSTMTPKTTEESQKIAKDSTTMLEQQMSFSSPSVSKEEETCKSFGKNFEAISFVVSADAYKNQETYGCEQTVDNDTATNEDVSKSFVSVPKLTIKMADQISNKTEGIEEHVAMETEPTTSESGESQNTEFVAEAVPPNSPQSQSGSEAAVESLVSGEVKKNTVAMGDQISKDTEGIEENVAMETEPTTSESGESQNTELIPETVPPNTPQSGSEVAGKSPVHGEVKELTVATDDQVLSKTKVVEDIVMKKTEPSSSTSRELQNSEFVTKTVQPNSPNMPSTSQGLRNDDASATSEENTRKRKSSEQPEIATKQQKEEYWKEPKYEGPGAEWKKSYRLMGCVREEKGKDGKMVRVNIMHENGCIIRGMPEGKAPHFPQQPVARQNDDGSLELECFVDASPTPTIKWYYDNNEVKQDGRFSSKLDNRSGDSFSAILSIKDLADADAGAYRCCIVNPHGKGNANFNLKLTGFSSPTFIEKPQISSRDDGQVMVMEFRAKSILTPAFVWHRITSSGGEEIVNNNERIRAVLQKEGDIYYSALEIKEPTKEKDAGQFVCTAKNDSGKLTATFTVKFEVPEGAPSFTRKPQILQKTSAGGEPAICFDIGYTAKLNPQVQWINPKGKKLKENSRIKFYGSSDGADGNFTAILELTNYKAKDSGTYTCNIKNDAGEANVELTLNIEGPLDDGAEDSES